MTKQVLAKLEVELKALKQALLVDIPKEIAAAASQGDLSENAEYEQALAKRDMFQSKVVAVEKRIAEVASMDLNRLPKDRVGYGSIVKLLDLNTEAEVSYHLVLPEELDGDKAALSISSPIGKALLGLKQGEDVEIRIPAGTKRFEVVGLTTFHDR